MSERLIAAYAGIILNERNDTNINSKNPDLNIFFKIVPLSSYKKISMVSPPSINFITSSKELLLTNVNTFVNSLIIEQYGTIIHLQVLLFHVQPSLALHNVVILLV